MAAYHFYSRTGCGLCDEMYQELLQLGLDPAQLQCVDIDQRPELAALYGAKVPVLERDGKEIAAGRLNDQSRLALRP